MLQQYRRLVSFLLAGFLVFNLVHAVTNSTQGNWLRVGLLALLLAFNLWRYTHTADKKDPPQDGR